MIYIDFDGVIFDTFNPLFDDYISFQRKGIYIDDVEYVKNKDWKRVLECSKIIGNGIDIIKSMDKREVTILTKINSLNNEGVSKVKLLRDLGVECNIILVPYSLKKTDIVDARGNILVDDTIKNLEDWEMSGGIPIFFDHYDNNIDGWGNLNNKFVRTRSLDIFKNKKRV